jgi:hypothetical protein
MSLKWIAECLQMRSWTYVSDLLKDHPCSPATQEALPLCQ